MKNPNYSYIGITFILLVFGIIFIPKIVKRVKQGDITRTESRSKNLNLNGATNTNLLSYLIINGERMKVPPFSFINQNRKTITNEDYKGKVFVLEFFFTTCPTICPKMNQNLVSLQNSFPNRSDFGIASITINPNYDTVEVLKDYADQYGVINPNWHFLTGNQEIIYELANSGFNLYAAQVEAAPGGFEHSGNFALIDKSGYIRSRLDDFGNPKIYYRGTISQLEQVNDEGEFEEISDLKEDILKLLNE